MSGQEDYRSGPHPTHAGNLFDPRVHGEEVRGVSGSAEGLSRDSTGITGDNTAVTGGSTSGLTSGTGLTGGSTSSYTGSNTGSGLTGTQGSGLSSTTSNENRGVVGTALGYLGLGGNSTNSNAGQVSDNDSALRKLQEESRHHEGEHFSEGGVAGSGTGTSVGAGSGTLGGYTDTRDRDSGLTGTGTGAGLGAASGIAAGGQGLNDRDNSNRDASISGTDSNNPRFASGSSTSAAADTTTNREPTTQDQRTATRNITDAPGADDEDGLGSRGSVAAETGRDEVGRAGTSSNDNTESSERKEDTQKSSHASDNKVAAKRENPSAIPFAGDIRVGEKHMGESKIVPDNPRPADDETAQNTAKNADAGEHKEGLMGKLKDKMPGHKH